MQHDFILIDRSGSMAGQWVEALASVNAYVKKLAEDKVDTGVTIVAFDQDGATFCFSILRDRITPSTMMPITEKDAHPRGMTPLNQATYKLVELANAHHYDKVAIIIMTDGGENSSAPDFTLAGAKVLLETCRAKGWQVIFLGANFDNATQSAGYGNAARSTITASVGNFVGTMTSTASKRSAYGLTGEAMTYTDEEKAKAAQKGSGAGGGGAGAAGGAGTPGPVAGGGGTP